MSLIGAAVAGAPAADAAAPSKPTAPSTLGNDVSWPQCGGALPTRQAFGIVGVNGGIASTTNACLATQLAWAANSTGVTAQPRTQLYVNTANPAGLHTATWPTSNLDPEGVIAPNPIGTCDGSDLTACAWQYGWDRAVEDITLRFLPAGQTAGVATDPASYRWWLDVETANSWLSGSAAAQESNRRALEAMTAKLQAVGATVGLYSTAYQLGTIAGIVPAGSNLHGLASWLPGARNEKSARSNCALAPLTAGGRVTITQFVANNIDVGVSCV